MNKSLEELTFERWIASLYGSYEEGLMRGVKPWGNLPDRTQRAWSEAVEFVVQHVKVKIMYSE